MMLPLPETPDQLPVESRRLVLHVGPGKTGSTALQKSLSTIQKYLNNQGCSALTLQFDFPEMMEVYSPQQFGKTIDEIDLEAKRQLFEHRIASLPGKTVVVSCEYMSGSMLYSGAGAVERTRMLTQNFNDVTIVFYVRRQDNMYESIFQQQYKNGESTGFDDFRSKFSPEKMSFLKRIQMFEAAFPGAEIVVRPYEFTIFERDILRDFLEAIGFMKLPARIRSFKSNLGFSPEALFILNTCKQVMPGEKYRKIRSMLGKKERAIRDVGSKRYQYLETAEREAILAFHREDNRVVFEKYGAGSADEFSQWEQFYERLPEEVTENEAAFSEQQMAQQAVVFLAEELLSKG